MTKKHLFVFLLVMIIELAHSQSTESQKTSINLTVDTETICPVEIVREAVALNSIELLKTAYSKRMIAIISESIEWEESFKHWKELGLDDYSCTIKSEKSQAVFFYQGKEMDVGMSIILESSGWKFDER